MQITITLKQLQKFLKKIEDKTARHKSLLRIKPILEETLVREVFNYQSGNRTIPTKAELRRLIKAKATDAKMGPPYSKEYLKRKKRMGEFLPHKYENYGFWMGTQVVKEGARVKIFTKPLESSRKGFDYLSHHERRRSVLKLTFFLSWQKIVDEIIKTYAEEAQK